MKFLVKSLYYDINELNDKLNDSQSIFKKTFSLMHVNISSLKYHLDKLSDLIDKSEAKFGVIGITESRLSKDIAPLITLTFITIRFSILQQSLIRRLFTVYLNRPQLQNSK